MTAIKIKPRELKMGMQALIKQTRNNLLAGRHLGKAETLPLQPMLKNPGLTISILAGQKLKGYRRESQ